MELVKKSIIVLSIIDIVLLLIYGILRWLSIINVGFTTVIDRLFAVVAFDISCIILIVTIILCIIQNKNIAEKNQKRSSLVVMTVLLLLNIVLPGTFLMVDNIKLKQSSELLNKATETLTEKANTLIKLIKNIENNKYIYLHDDLSQINTKIVETIDKGSYVTYYDNRAYACISDENYKISGNQDSLKVTKIRSNKDQCHYYFADIGETPYQHNEGEHYLKYYISEKYGLEVKSVKTNYDCSTFVACTLKNYEVVTSKGTITAELTINNNKIEETDNYGFVYASTLLQEDLIDYMYNNKYIVKPFIVNGGSNVTDISSININDLNNELWISFTVVIKKDNRSDEIIKQISNKMIEWYQKHNIYGSTNFVVLGSDEYEEVNEYNFESIKRQYNVNNLISCTVKESGETKID